MPTKNDYERLLMYQLKKGNVVRVPMKTDSNYHSQRMIFYRVLNKLKQTIPDLQEVSTSRVVENGVTYLEIQNAIPQPGTFLFKEGGIFIEKEIPENMPTAEELDFLQWQEKIRKEKENEND